MSSNIDHEQALARGGVGWLVPHRDVYLSELDKLGDAVPTISRDVDAYVQADRLRGDAHRIIVFTYICVPAYP